MGRVNARIMMNDTPSFIFLEHLANTFGMGGGYHIFILPNFFEDDFIRLPEGWKLDDD